MVVPATPARKLPRPALFTPKRPLSTTNSSSASTSTSSTDLASLNSRAAGAGSVPSRSTTPLLSSTHKRYKAPLSTESKTRSALAGASASATTNARPKPVPSVTSTPAPASPEGKRRSASRPRTPGTPRRGGGAESPSLMPAASEMDVSNVDPEDVLVDWKTDTVEPGDVSGELDEAWLNDALGIDKARLDHGKEDKVMVSIRVRPTDSHSAWVPSHETCTIKLDPKHAKNPSTNTSSNSSPNANSTSGPFTFDAVLSGSPNKPIYSTVARSHVQAAMEGYNAVIFAYGQTASGKTYTLTGDTDEPGIIPRAMRDVFAFIKRTPGREYLLRCSYLEIYNETIHDLLAPPTRASAHPVQVQGGPGGPNEIVLTPLREEVVTSLKGVKDVLRRGEGNRRTACTDWNERSSRSHSVFRMVIESRERGSSSRDDDDDDDERVMRSTPSPGNANGRRTPGLGLGSRPQTPGPNRLQARGGKSVQTSVLSLIDLAGSEKATSDKERTREGKYINTSLLTLGTVIGTLAENAAKNKNDHVPYRNSKLTRMLQPSLSGNARISVICTINPDVGAVSESLSTLLFARRIKGVQLRAQKKEVVDTEALIERYRKEIEELKKRLAEREAEMPVRSRRLSAREQIDESKAMKDLNARIQQLTKLILTSQTVVDGSAGDGASRASSPVKVDFDMSPYQLQQELLSARLQLESQANQILSLEAALDERPPLLALTPTPGPGTPDSEKDRLIQEQAERIRELETLADTTNEDEDGAGTRRSVEDVEREWRGKLEEEVRKREEIRVWAEELAKGLEREKKIRVTLEEERRALQAFVSKFDSLGLGSGASPSATPSSVSASLSGLGLPQSRLRPPLLSSRRSSLAPISEDPVPKPEDLVQQKLEPTTPVSAASASQAAKDDVDDGRTSTRTTTSSADTLHPEPASAADDDDAAAGAVSPMKLVYDPKASLLLEQAPPEDMVWGDVSFGDAEQGELEHVPVVPSPPSLLLLPSVVDAGVTVSAAAAAVHAKAAAMAMAMANGRGPAVGTLKGSVREVFADKENVDPAQVQA